MKLPLGILKISFFAWIALSASLLHAEIYPAEFSSPVISEARHQLDSVVLADFSVKDISLWEAFSEAGRRAKKTSLRFSLPEFVLKSAKAKPDAETKVTLHLQNARLPAIIDALAQQAGCVWFCNENTVVMLAKSDLAEKIIADNSPLAATPPPPASLCEVNLDKKEVSAAGVTLYWKINASGIPRELLVPNLAFHILPRDEKGALVKKKIAFKDQKFEDTDQPGKYRYTVVLENVTPDIKSLELKVLYTGTPIFQENTMLK
ncbi:MAG: hypothetical protein ABI615_03650 [Chthoniobacterales bacterium]